MIDKHIYILYLNFLIQSHAMFQHLKLEEKTVNIRELCNVCDFLLYWK